MEFTIIPFPTAMKAVPESYCILFLVVTSLKVDTDHFHLKNKTVNLHIWPYKYILSLLSGTVLSPVMGQSALQSSDYLWWWEGEGVIESPMKLQIRENAQTCRY